MRSQESHLYPKTYLDESFQEESASLTVMNVSLEWQGGAAFRAKPPTGVEFVLDSHPDSGGQRLGPTPMESLLGSLAACSAMDVLAILEKKRQKVTSYKIEIKGVRPPEGEYPRGFVEIEIVHVLDGEELDPKAIERAIELSETKYCSVLATVRGAPSVKSTYSVAQKA